ncbi:MAG TPA: MFS transporter [Bryobacteraceae bacterium]|jgi:Na+/melibiose symporter-like transporter|nr:MFS transporter [Bryobacteraceae bacterium]
MGTPALSSPPTLDASPRPLAISAKLLYGVGEIPITVLMVLSGLFILFFYNSVMGLPAAQVGIGLFASLALDAITDPLIGHLSDRTRSRLGRRHAFMLPGALGMGPCFFLLFSPPRTLGHTGLFLWLLGTMIALRATSAIYRIPYLGLGAELSRDYDDRTSTMAVRAVFGLIGTLAAAGLSFLLFFPATTDGSEPRLHYEGYPHLGLAFGAMMSVCGLISFFGTLGHRTSGAGNSSAAPSFLAAFRISMQNVEFRRLWGSSTTFFLAVVLNASMAIQYFTWYARINGAGAMSAIQTSFYIGALIGVFQWMALARRTEKRTLAMVAVTATATVLLMSALLVGEGRLFGTGHVLPLIIGSVIGGIFASAVWVIPPSMVADVADIDELRTGLRREGIYFGISNFGEKIAAGGALLLSGTLLTVFGKLSHAVPKGAPAATPYLGILYGAAPAVLLMVSLLFIIPYGLNRETVHRIQRELAERRAAA